MSQDTFIIQVDCYSGYRGEETPRRFTMDTKTIEVAGILDRWLHQIIVTLRFGVTITVSILSGMTL